MVCLLSVKLLGFVKLNKETFAYDRFLGINETIVRVLWEFLALLDVCKV